MGRTGFWNKKRVSEAKHYPTGIRRYCDKHGVTFESYQNYCFRHSISSVSKVTDGRGNSMWTFELFQQALKAPSANSFCKDHNLSYSMFYHYKKFGFPGQKVTKKELQKMNELAANTAIDSMELTDEDMKYIFNDVETVSDLYETELTKNNDSMTADVEVPVDTNKKHRKPNGFWTLELINTAKTYPDGIEKFCEDYDTTVKAYKMACARLGVSASIKYNKLRSKQPNKMHRTRTYLGRKESFWSIEKIEEAKSYPGGIEKFCADNGTTVKAYTMACYIRGIDHHIEPVTGKTNKRNPRGFWTLERIEEAKSYPGGVKAFCNKYHISVSTYRGVCSRFGVSSRSNDTIVEESAKIVEPIIDNIPTVEYTKSRNNSIMIKYKDGRIKEVSSANELTLFIGSSEIDEITFDGNGMISFI